MNSFGDERDWFVKKRFGLFLHFGLYAIEGWHEQDQMRRSIPRSEYQQLITRFNPVDFNADYILDLAESVGMEYVCLTTKHHDGFCLWDTTFTDYNIMNTPYGKDLVAELADACHRRGFPLGLYYSIADWHHPSYPNEGRHHELPPQPTDQPDWQQYLDFLKNQVRELCTHYGKIHHFFWDVNVPKYKDPSINAMLRQLQPCMVINDRGFDDGDFGTPEREYQKNELDHVIRFNKATEACNSVDTQSWGYRQQESYYSSSYLKQMIDIVMAKGGNYLLNVGPDAKGQIPKTAQKLLQRIGTWYTKVREAFDAEPATELVNTKNIFVTRRENLLYIHLPYPTADTIVLQPLVQQPRQAVLLNTGELLSTSVEYLPSLFFTGQSYLQVKGLPIEGLLGEPFVLRLDFGERIDSKLADPTNEFEG
ncbi:MAG: alpha-L-fucosidase [Gloeotrichia echinulata GP01]